jgi:hypothetical protein
MVKKWMGAATLGLAGAMAAVPAQAVPVGLELALMADVSGSLDATDFNLQRDGYAAAFRNAAVHSAIAGASGGVAVTFVYWSSGVTQSIGWTLLTDAASSNAFADLIAGTARPFSGSTRMTNALTFTSGLFAGNGFEGAREVIDVSGDGADSDCGSFVLSCAPLQTARDAFLAGGSARTINALWIDDRDFFGDDPADSINALSYGSTNVIGGTNAFQAIAQNFDDFQAQILAKIGREITGGTVPAPGGLALVGLALAALALTPRRR